MGDLLTYLYDSTLSFVFLALKQFSAFSDSLYNKGINRGTEHHSSKAEINQSLGSPFLHLGDSYQVKGYPKSYQQL